MKKKLAPLVSGYTFELGLLGVIILFLIALLVVHWMGIFFVFKDIESFLQGLAANQVFVNQKSILEKMHTQIFEAEFLFLRYIFYILCFGLMLMVVFFCLTRRRKYFKQHDVLLKSLAIRFIDHFPDSQVERRQLWKYMIDSFGQFHGDEELEYFKQQSRVEFEKMMSAPEKRGMNEIRDQFNAKLSLLDKEVAERKREIRFEIERASAQKKADKEFRKTCWL